MAMGDEDLLRVLDLYMTLLRREGLDWFPDDPDAIDHVRDMLPQMYEFLADGRREKLMRWLGFVQGVLWTQGVYSIDDLRDHNRPEASHAG